MVSRISIEKLISDCNNLERKGKIAEALPLARNALILAEQQLNPEIKAQAYLAVARLRFRLGQYDEARELALKTQAGLNGNSPLLTEVCQVLANCAAETGNLEEAENYYYRAAVMARELSQHRSLCAALHGLAVGVYMPRGQFSLLIATETEVRQIINEYQMSEEQLYPLVALAMTYILVNSYKEAKNVLEQLGKCVTNNSIAEGYYGYLKASLALRMGDITNSARLLEKTRAIADKTGEPWINVRIRLGMSQWCTIQGDFMTAQNWAWEAYQYACRVGYTQEKMIALIEHARIIILSEGSYSDAVKQLCEASEISLRLSAVYEKSRIELLKEVCSWKMNAELLPDHWLRLLLEIHRLRFDFIFEIERDLVFPVIKELFTIKDTGMRKELIGLFKNITPPVLNIITLGEFTIRSFCRTITASQLRPRRAGELFAILLLAAGNKLPIEQVCETMFPNTEVSKYRSIFHQTTSTLRRLLEPDLPEKFPSRYLVLEDDQIKLMVPEGSWLDWVEFERSCRHQNWEQAVDMYNGEFLPDYRYSEWAAGQREWLHILAVNACLEVASLKLLDNHFSEALDACQKALEIDPWQEKAVFLGMQACLGRSDRISAIRMYQNLEKKLRDDLNTEPEDELRELYLALF